jgi:hypothetical protein
MSLLLKSAGYKVKINLLFAVETRIKLKAQWNTILLKYRAFHSAPHLAVTGPVVINAFSKWNQRQTLRR